MTKKPSGEGTVQARSAEVERRVRPCCGNCHYWSKIKPTPQSWGLCQHPTRELVAPYWVHVILNKYNHQYGSVSPESGRDCKAFTAA